MLTLASFDDLNAVFAIEGDSMRRHRGRSIVRVNVDGGVHYLKRFWLTPRQLLRGLVSQGLHELAMIDWLNANGFLGPEVVARGVGTRLGLRTRMYFLMRQVSGELPLERFYRNHKSETDQLICALAAHTARLHDQAFYHCDYSERHVFVGQNGEGYHFRQIDVERATVGKQDESRAAADLKTLQSSIADETFAALIGGEFIDYYLASRNTAPPADRFRALFAAAEPTKSFF